MWSPGVVQVLEYLQDSLGDGCCPKCGAQVKRLTVKEPGFGRPLVEWECAEGHEGVIDYR